MNMMEPLPSAREGAEWKERKNERTVKEVLCISEEMENEVESSP